MSNARQDALDRTSRRDVTDWWSTAISDIEPGSIRFRGFAIEQLIGTVSFPQMIWLMLRGELPSPAHASLLENALVAAVDHGPQAPSIAAARMASTCGVGLHGAMSTGVGLLGDVHGGAGQQCMALLEHIRSRSSDTPVVEVVAEVVADHRSRRTYIPGFGHRFHAHDPRRDPLLGAVRAQVEAGTVEGAYLEIAEEIERQISIGRSAPVPMNVDGATAVIYAELGFAAELGRGLFILSRSVGILAHSWEEIEQGRRIKGPIPPPLLPTYTGTAPRDVANTVPAGEA